MQRIRFWLRACFGLHVNGTDARLHAMHSGLSTVARANMGRHTARKKEDEVVWFTCGPGPAGWG